MVSTLWVSHLRGRTRGGGAEVCRRLEQWRWEGQRQGNATTVQQCDHDANWNAKTGGPIPPPLAVAPVHVGAAGHARRVEHVGGLHLQDREETHFDQDADLLRLKHTGSCRARASAPGASTRPTTLPSTHPLKVGQDGGTVLQAGSAVLELGALLLQQLAHQAACAGGVAGGLSG